MLQCPMSAIPPNITILWNEVNSGLHTDVLQRFKDILSFHFTRLGYNYISIGHKRELLLQEPMVME